MRRGSANCADPSHTQDSGNRLDATRAMVAMAELDFTAWYIVPRHCPLTGILARRDILARIGALIGQAVPCLWKTG